MALVTGHPSRNASPSSWSEGLGFDVGVAALGAWFVAGLFLDGWAHAHLPGLESFFTPWHAVFYSGYGATAAFVAAAALRNRAAGRTWREALPAGHGLTALGLALFGFGGAFDLAWHALFGIEVSVEALLSPSHLLLAFGMALVVTGPVRAWLHRREAGVGLARSLPAVVGVALLLDLLTFFTQPAHPLVRPWALTGNRPVEAVFPLADGTPAFVGAGSGVPALDVAAASGVAGLLLQTALLVGVALWIRDRALPAGAFAVVFGVNGLMLGAMRSTLAFSVSLVLAGLVAEVLARHVRRDVFAPALAASFGLLYFAALALSGGVWWSVHLWLGVVVMAAAAAWLLATLSRPASNDANVAPRG